MRFVQIETLPSGKALVDIDKLTHAVPEGEGTRLYLGAQHLDVPHTLQELENGVGASGKPGAVQRAGGTRADRRRREQRGRVRHPLSRPPEHKRARVQDS